MCSKFGEDYYYYNLLENQRDRIFFARGWGGVWGEVFSEWLQHLKDVYTLAYELMILYTIHGTR